MEIEGILKMQKGISWVPYFVSLDKSRILSCYRHMNDEAAELEIYLGGTKTVIELATQIMVKFKDDRGHEFVRFESKHRSLNFAFTNSDVGKCKFQTPNSAMKAKWVTAISKEGQDRRSSDAPPSSLSASDKTGWLSKLGGSYGKWQKRFFVCDAKAALITYHKAPPAVGVTPGAQDAAAALGAIDCRQIQLIRRSYLKKFGFAIHTPSRIFYCRAEDETQKKDWMQYLHLLQRISQAQSNSVASPRSSIGGGNGTSNVAKSKGGGEGDVDFGNGRNAHGSDGKLTFVDTNSTSSRQLNSKRVRASVYLPALKIASTLGQITTQKYFMTIKQPSTLLRRAFSDDGATVDSVGARHEGGLFWNSYYDAEHGYFGGQQLSFWITLSNVTYARCDPQGKRPLRSPGIGRQDTMDVPFGSVDLDQSLAGVGGMPYGSARSESGVLDDGGSPTLPAPSGASTPSARRDEPAGVYVAFQIVHSGESSSSAAGKSSNAAGDPRVDGALDDEDGHDTLSTVLRTEVQAVPYSSGEFEVKFCKSILIELRHQWANVDESSYLAFTVNVSNRMSSSKFRLVDRGRLSLLSLKSSPVCSASLELSRCRVSLAICAPQVSCYLPQIFAPIQQIFRLHVRTRARGTVKTRADSLLEETSGVGGGSGGERERANSSSSCGDEDSSVEVGDDSYDVGAKDVRSEKSASTVNNSNTGACPDFVTVVDQVHLSSLSFQLPALFLQTRAEELMNQVENIARWQSCLRTALGQFPSANAAFREGWGCARVTVKQGQGIVDFCGVSNSFARVLFGAADRTGAGDVDAGGRVESSSTDSMLLGTTCTEYSTDAPKWGVREFKVPGKYRHSARRHHLLAARNSFAGLMRYVDTRSHQLATNVGDGSAPKSDGRAIRTQRSRTAELVNKTTAQADKLATHFKTFQVYVPPIDPGYHLRFSHKEWSSMSAIADRIADDCGIRFRQLPKMFRYFTGKDMVEWILANLRTGSNDTAAVVGTLDDNGDITEIASEPRNQPLPASEPRNPYARHVGAVSTRAEACQLAAKLVVAGIVANVDRGMGFVDSKDVIFMTSHRHCDRLQPVDEILCRGRSDSVASMSSPHRTQRSASSAGGSGACFFIEVREDKPVPQSEFGPASDVVLDEPMLPFATEDPQTGTARQTPRRYSRIASSSKTPPKPDTRTGIDTANDATLPSSTAETQFLAGGAMQPPNIDVDSIQPALGELLGSATISLPQTSLENPFVTSSRWLNLAKPGSDEVLGQVLVEVEVEYRPDLRVSSLDISDDKQVLLLAARHFVAQRGRQDARRLIAWIDRYSETLQQQAQKYKQLSAYYAAKFSSLEQRAAETTDLQALDVPDEFRPSVRKGDELVDAIPINLHVHSTHCIKHFGNQRTDGKSLSCTPATSESFHIISMGAPAAHAMKFKNGLGLREHYAKLEELHKKSIVRESRAFVGTLTTDQASSSSALDDGDSSGDQRDDVKFGTPAASLYDEKFSKRQDMCLSQALCAVTAAFTAHVQEAMKRGAIDIMALEIWSQAGYLFHIECLLSTHGAEMGMISDLAFTMSHLLCNVSFKFVLDPHAPPNAPTRDVTSCKLGFGFRGSKYIVSVNLGSTDMARLPKRLRNGGLVNVVPILLQQGINEWQSYANSVGNTGYKSRAINEPNCKRVRVYAERVRRLVSDLGGDIVPTRETQALLGEIRALLHYFVAAVHKEQDNEKNYDIHLTAMPLVRALKGGRMTCCKSGKDRTAMSVTLEQGEILGSKFGLELPPPESGGQQVLEAQRSRKEFQKLGPALQNTMQIAQVFREHGVRLAVCKRNIGKSKFAFNKLQRTYLPDVYKPPSNIVGDKEVLPT